MQSEEIQVQIPVSVTTGCMCVLVSDLQVDGDGLRVGFALPALELVLQPQQHRSLVPLAQCQQVDSRGQRSLQPRELQTEKVHLRCFRPDEGRGRGRAGLSSSLTSSSVFGCKSPSVKVSSGCSTISWPRGRYVSAAEAGRSRESSRRPRTTSPSGKMSEVSLRGSPTPR